jgi:hypothetical protein
MKYGTDSVWLSVRWESTYRIRDLKASKLLCAFVFYFQHDDVLLRPHLGFGICRLFKTQWNFSFKVGAYRDICIRGFGASLYQHQMNVRRLE